MLLLSNVADKPVMISYQQAFSIVNQQSFNWGTETCALSAAAGRILRQAVSPDRPQPPFNRVTMDGIAINYTAYTSGQRLFPVERVQPAGTAAIPLNHRSNCIEIMTGAALPLGVSTVIRYEDLVKKGNAFEVPDEIEDQKNIHFIGSDATTDQELMQPGRKIGVAEIGILATFGYAEVVVSSLPRVAIVSTGNELVEVHEQPLDHQIRRSNVYQLAHLLTHHGINPSLHHLPDEPTIMRKQLAMILAENDLVLLSGGVSMGKLDYVPQVLAELGVEKLLHRVAQRPGKPLWVGRTRSTMVFGLPGNPISSIVGLIAHVNPFIRKNLWQQETQPLTAKLSEPFSFAPSLTLFQLVSTNMINGVMEATPVTNAGSGDATSLLRGNGFIQLPAHRTHFEESEHFPFFPLNQ